MTAGSEASDVAGVDFTHFRGKGRQDVWFKGKVYGIEVKLAENVVVACNRGRRGGLGVAEATGNGAFVLGEVVGGDDLYQQSGRIEKGGEIVAHLLGRRFASVEPGLVDR